MNMYKTKIKIIWASDISTLETETNAFLDHVQNDLGLMSTIGDLTVIPTVQGLQYFITIQYLENTATEEKAELPTLSGPRS